MEERIRADVTWRAVDTGGKCILVVDDNETVGQVVADLLQALGYAVVVCRTADEALVWCQSRQIDAVLTEVGLRTREGSGFPAVLSSRYPGLPIAVLTGWIDHPETLRLDPHGPWAVLSKPVRVQDLGLAMRSLTSGCRRM